MNQVVPRPNRALSAGLLFQLHLQPPGTESVTSYKGLQAGESVVGVRDLHPCGLGWGRLASLIAHQDQIERRPQTWIYLKGALLVLQNLIVVSVNPVILD